MIHSDKIIFTGKPGKLPAKTDPRALNFSTFFDSTKICDVPTELNWGIKKTTPWGMMNNWTLSDCTCAAAGHMIECWTANASKEHIIDDKAIMDIFIALSGYDPITGKNDNPIYLSDALKYWRKNGVGSHKIKAYATVNYKNHDLVRATIYLFGGVYVGFCLPKTIKGQEVWEVMPGGFMGDNAPGSFGGHAVNVIAYDETHLTCISWGKIKKMTWEFWDAYCDELYAIISEDFFKENKTPLGLDLITLEASLLNITKSKKTFEKQINKNQTKMNEEKKSKEEVKVHTKIEAGSAGTSASVAGNEANLPVHEHEKVGPKKKGPAGNAGTTAA